MPNYYMNRNAQSNGDHEVHKESCNRMPDLQNRLYLGSFLNCQGAVAEAKKINPRADGCYYCSRECHKS